MEAEARQIYQHFYGHVDDDEFKVVKTGDINEWFVEGYEERLREWEKLDTDDIFKMDYPFTQGAMDKVGIEITDTRNAIVRCKRCGAEWSPDARSEGHLAPGYWHCPHGCNDPSMKNMVVINVDSGSITKDIEPEAIGVGPTLPTRGGRLTEKEWHVAVVSMLDAGLVEWTPEGVLDWTPKGLRS